MSLSAAERKASRDLHDFERWAALLEGSARALLGPRARGADGDSYRVCATACPLHGPHCARVVYGVLMEHFDWPREDPDHLAERLTRTMLPPSDG
jgi:hypothetical protein